MRLKIDEIMVNNAYVEIKKTNLFVESLLLFDDKILNLMLEGHSMLAGQFLYSFHQVGQQRNFIFDKTLLLVSAASSRSKLPAWASDWV